MTLEWEWRLKLLPPDNGNLVSKPTEQAPWARSYMGDLHCACQVKEARPKASIRCDSICVTSVVEKAELEGQRREQWLPVPNAGWGVTTKGV